MSGSVKRLIILSIVADHVAAAHKQADKTRSRTQIEPIRSIRDPHKHTHQSDCHNKATTLLTTQDCSIL